MYKVRGKLLIITFLVALSVRADEGEKLSNQRFDSVFYDAAVRVSTVDMKRAEVIADSLFKASTSDIHKIKSLMLSASLLEKQSKRAEAIGYALKADKIASSTSYYRWIARIYVFLATQFRLIGLADYSKEYLEKGELNSEKIEDKTQANICLGMVFQEKAHHALNEEKFNESIKLLSDANRLFEEVSNEHTKNLFIGINSEMIGRSFIELKKKDSARYYYDKSLTCLGEIGLLKSEYSGLVFHGKAYLFLEEENLEQAKVLLDKALSIASTINQQHLLELIYRDLSKYHQRKNNIREYSVFYEKYLKVREYNIKAKQKAVNAEVNRIFKKQEGKVSLLYWLLSGVFVLFILGLIIIFTQKKKFKKERQLFDAFMSKVQNSVESKKNTSSISKNDTEKLECENKNTEERLMSTETEALILQKLKEFEAENGFTDNKLTLTILSAKFEVNTKYLSWVINEHKKKDFNNYINQLRISYIVDKIKTDPDYLNYKISYLSLESGFSSHSKFTSIFKKETGVTPSFFIDQLKKESGIV